MAHSIMSCLRTKIGLLVLGHGSLMSIIYFLFPIYVTLDTEYNTLTHPPLRPCTSRGGVRPFEGQFCDVGLVFLHAAKRLES